MWHTIRTLARAGRAVFGFCIDSLKLRLFDLFVRHGVTPPVKATAHQQPRLEQQQYRLSLPSDTTSEEFLLSDCRTLGFAYFGAEKGWPVFYFHGYPGCGLSGGVFFDRAAKDVGVRIIAVDRPGIGNSSPHPGRKPLDLAEDVRELADHLRLTSYGVIGVSGGGPYALACARALPPEKLRGVSIIGGMGPIDTGFKGMSWSNWLTFIALMYAPFIIRWVQNKVVHLLRTMPNEKIVAEVQNKMTERKARLLGPDFRYLLHPESLTTMLDLYREHYKQGIDGYMEDGRVLTSDWGFRVEEVPRDIPIQMWYSKMDTNVPLRMGEVIASRLASPPEFHIKEHETHLELVLNCNRKALDSLVENM